MKYLILLLLVHIPLAIGQEQVVLEGLPTKRIERTAEFSTATVISGLESQSSAVRITKADDIYYWSSRGNIPMSRIEDGIYITYVAVDGSGYVRTLNAIAREVFQRQASDDQVGQTMYVEHILVGLESLTYYGR